MSTYTSIDKQLKSDLILHLNAEADGESSFFSAQILVERLVKGKPRGRKKPAPPADILISN